MNKMIPEMVSTIIPVYNRPELLIEAVESVLAQTYRPIEILIIDDGSSDNVPGVIAGFVKRYPQIIRSVRFDSNRGPGPAREAGRQMARGEFLQYLDSDDLLLPGKFEIQVEALKNSPECGIAYGYTKLVDEHGKGEDVPCKWTGKTFREIFPALLIDHWWCTHTPLYRRTLCDRIGPWSDLRWSQDWEYNSRAGALNTKLVHCREFVSMHRHHSGIRQTSKADWSSPERAENRARFLKELYLNASKAGITPEDKEMQHFSRWMFLVSRRCGSAGLSERSRECFNISRKACGPERAGKVDFILYAAAARFFGWNCTGKLACLLLDSFKSHNPGKGTLKQSWMDE